MQIPRPPRDGSWWPQARDSRENEEARRTAATSLVTACGDPSLAPRYLPATRPTIPTPAYGRL